MFRIRLSYGTMWVVGAAPTSPTVDCVEVGLQPFLNDQLRFLINLWNEIEINQLVLSIFKHDELLLLLALNKPSKML